jgi:orotate phosphoribosyltransferase
MLLAEHSYEQGKFVLSSGATSDFYIDARRTTMSPEGLRVIGTLGLLALRATGWEVDSLGGLTLGADPVAYAISYTSTESPPLLRAFTVRKEAKSHGTGRLIEGPFLPGDRCVVVEDVITTGTSALRAVQAIQDAGGTVTGVLAVVDREGGGRTVLERTGLPIITLATLTELREAHMMRLATDRVKHT